LTKQVCFTADDGLVEKLDFISENSAMSRSQICNEFLKYAVAKFGSGRLTEGFRPVKKFESFEEYLSENPQIRVIFESMPSDQQLKWRENWKKIFLRGEHAEKKES